MSPSTIAGLDRAHAEALELAAAGEPDRAAELLTAALAAATGAEALNDLAVLLVQRGDRARGRQVLELACVLHPDDDAARENLRSLELLELGGPALLERPGLDGERQRRFLDLLLASRRRTLADNVDHLFAPYGEDLAAYADTPALVARWLDVLDGLDRVWDGMGDEASRELLLRLLAHRVLGPAHVRLQLEPLDYRRTVIGLTSQALEQANAVAMPGMPFEWGMHLYDLQRVGLPIKVIGPPLPLASTIAFSQYAYRDAAAGAAPRAGDVALDVGGCWGETALWLAHVVGPAGRVHTFEPTPGNRRLLERNLALNPHLAGRIAVGEEALAAHAGATVYLPDVVGAGATMRTAAHGDRPAVPVRTQTIDALVASGRVERVDFLKVDVEGADPGVLEGALETIARDRPRLALAAYHQDDDLAVLPEIVERSGVRYRWYLQCSTMTVVDSVLFGVPA